MKTFRLIFAVCFVSIFAASLEAAPQKKHQTTHTIAPEKLKDGNVLTCYTVLKGTKADPFGVVVNGPTTRHPLWPREKMILADMKNPNLPVAHGMSGSPCYLGNRLVGALAMNFAIFPMGAGVAGITPARAMLDPMGTQGGSGVAPSRAVEPVALMTTSPELVEALNKRLGYKRFEISEAIFSGGSAGGASTLPPRRIRAGEMVMGVLADGDFPFSYGCTATTSDEKGFTLCGHPVFGEIAGKLHYDAFRASVARIVKSNFSSTKMMGERLEPVGTITEDTAFAVRGVHQMEDNLMLPVHLKVTVDGRPYDYNFRVVRNGYFSPILTEFALRDIAGRVWSTSNVGTARLGATISIKGKQPYSMPDDYALISRQQILFGGKFVPQDPWMIFAKFNQRAATVLNNPFGLEAEKIDIALDIWSGDQIMSGDSIDVFGADCKDLNDLKNCKPVIDVHMGEELKVVVGLRKKNGESIATPFRIRIPEKINFLPTGNESDRFLPIELYIVSGSNYRELDPKKVPKGPPNSADEFLEQLSMEYRGSSEVFVILHLPPEKKAESNIPPPELEEGKWTSVPNLDFLREQGRGSERNVVALKLPSIENAVVSFSGGKQLRLIIK